MTHDLPRAMLACDADTRCELPGPRIIMPKIDGVRAYYPTPTSGPRARTGRPFSNRRVAELCNHPAFYGLDWEFAAGHPTDPDLCRNTTSVLNSHDAPVDGLEIWVFDMLPQAHLQNFKLHDAPYQQRYEHAAMVAQYLQRHGYPVRSVVGQVVGTMAEALEVDDSFTASGYEGSIMRDPNARYKHGRATQREGSYLRIKSFMDAEIEVVGLQEGFSNQNAAELNHVGLTKRATLAEGMVPNGMVATLLGRMLKDAVCPKTKAVLLRAGQEVTVSHGRMTHQERTELIQHPELALGKLAKFRFFPHGHKDNPRHPTFQCWRSPDDL